MCKNCKNVFDILKKKSKKIFENEIIEKETKYLNKINNLENELKKYKNEINIIKDGKYFKNSMIDDSFFLQLIDIQKKNINRNNSGKRWMDNENFKNYVLLLSYFSSKIFFKIFIIFNYLIFLFLKFYFYFFFNFLFKNFF